MIKSTLIFRDDGLPLCSSVDDDTDSQLSEQRKKVKVLVSRLTPNSADEATLESGSFEIHYIRENMAAYFVIAEKGYPRNLAFSYLKEVAQEFEHSYGNEYGKPSVRPYAFVTFDNFLQKTKKLYSDKRVQNNLDQLNQDLSGVKQIMTKNIEDLLYRGDSLDKMSDLSASLRQNSKKYRKSAQKINFDLLISQYAPIAVVAFVLVFLIWWVFLKSK
ncbi:LANO_0C04522g1_1 [Lachancea nothofagi CBS 11611]|uniref:Protein transport protein SEC22 n=1 Tax=Lachancea nothofagi CBS 11611 TaxID=1266666 RepID=A0A1G4J6P8_9SACH|nr:LANO_0C04522g1_1 [Lachancea nothofagi CBS 11611]